MKFLGRKYVVFLFMMVIIVGIIPNEAFSYSKENGFLLFDVFGMRDREDDNFYGFLLSKIISGEKLRVGYDIGLFEKFGDFKFNFFVGGLSLYYQLGNLVKTDSFFFWKVGFEANFGKREVVENNTKYIERNWGLGVLISMNYLFSIGKSSYVHIAVGYRKTFYNVTKC